MVGKSASKMTHSLVCIEWYVEPQLSPSINQSNKQTKLRRDRDETDEEEEVDDDEERFAAE